ncbi:MAG: tetratricopeptide repeat protein, partial [Terriglobales bacterium]
DLELALAKAYEAAGEKEKAQHILRRIYFEMPVSPEADAAVLQLRALGESQLSGSFEQRSTRSELLLKARRFQDAVSELSPLVELSPPDKMVAMQSQFGTALYKTRKRDDAYRLFENIAKNESASVEARAQALYFLAEISRDREDRAKQAGYLIQLRALAPESSWLQEALFSAGNMYMLRNEFENAIPFYTEMYQRQRNGRYSPFTHWRSAWLSYRLGKKDEAKRLFEEQLEMYPSSSEVPAAVYWRGRLAEEEGDKALARAYYQKLAQNFRYFYYAYRGHARMEAMGGDQVADPAPLDKLPPPVAPPRNWDAPEDNLRLKRAQLLANGALYDFAVKEMQAAASGTPPWLAKAISELYMGQGSYIHSIETLKRTVPGYFSAEIPQIPRPVWEGLFPRPFWDELKRDSEQNHLDPYLVASLIRQESEFNPAAVSSANALGLMQL